MNPSPAPPAPPVRRSSVTFFRRVGQGLLRQPRSVAWILPCLWALGIWSLSQRTLDLGLPHSLWSAWLGNGLHAFEFGVLAILSLPLLRRRGDWVDWRGVGPRCLALACIGAGWMDEWVQSGVSGRSASLWDVLTDGVGVMVSLAVVFLLTDASLAPRRFHRAVLVGIMLCALAAGLSTAWDHAMQAGWWPLPRRSAG